MKRFALRLLPETLGGRLVATVVLLALTTTLVTIAVDAAFSPGELADNATLVSAIAAIAVGVALGLLLARVTRGPVARLVAHVKSHGSGSAVPPDHDEGITDDPLLPREFRELAVVVEDLVHDLEGRHDELTLAMRTAQSAEETLSVVVNESLELNLMLDGDRVSVANPAAAVALGAPGTTLIGMTAIEAFSSVTMHAEDGAALEPARLIERAMERPTAVSVVREEQPERWYEFVAVKREGEERDRTLISARDITEDRRLQSIRAEIVSLISHDLRSPLAVVIGYLDLLRQPLAPEDRDRAIDSAKRNAGRMADLLEDLLSATRAEELLAATALVPVHLSTLASEVVESVAPMHAERDVLFEAECSPIVLGEEKRLRQVLVNLVTNAFKYAPDRTPVHVRLACHDSRVSILVVDHGSGVPEPDRARIFDRFARLENGTSRPGMGLGLYIVRIITEHHGGSVHVEDTPGGGATFVVDLPLAGLLVDGRIVPAGSDDPEASA